MTLAIKVWSYEPDAEYLSTLAHGLEARIAEAVAEESEKGEVVDVSVLASQATSEHSEPGDHRTSYDTVRGYLILVKVRSLSTWSAIGKTA